MALLGPAAHAAAPGVPSAALAQVQLAELVVAEPGSEAGCSRDRFAHWTTGPDGCTTRETTLRRDGSGVTTDPGCTVTGGTWESPYDGATATDPADIDIDHVVPLAEAWRSGAAGWSDDRRADFANDLDRPALLAVTSSVNQSKADLPPDLWQPPAAGYRCTYARMWIGTKTNWELSVTTTEKVALSGSLDGC